MIMRKMISPHVRVWEFRVSPKARRKFERVYGPRGEWVRLFKKGKGFLRTDLFRDEEKRGRYLAVDYWISKGDYKNFRRKFEHEYESLDKRCESLTTLENS